MCFPIGKLKNLRLGNENTGFPVGKLKNLKNLKSEHRSKQTGAPAFKKGISWCKSDGKNSSSRLRGVSSFTIARKKPDFGEPPASSNDDLSKLLAALACAGCTYLLKLLFLPRRRANLTYPRRALTDLLLFGSLVFPFSVHCNTSPFFSFLRRRQEVVAPTSMS